MQWKYFFQKWFNLRCEQSSVLWTQKRQNLSFSLKFLAGEGTNKSVSETMVQLLKINQTVNTLQEQLKRANLRLELHGLQIGEQNRLSEILERHLNATDSMLGNHQEQLIQVRQDLDEQRNETGFQLDILEQTTSVSEQKFVHDLAQALKKELGSFNNFHSGLNLPVVALLMRNWRNSKCFRMSMYEMWKPGAMWMRTCTPVTWNHVLTGKWFIKDVLKKKKNLTPCA